MLHFTRLRLSAFKSFVDSADISIEPGLTGIVGPNGCGKSNLIEALRWVMGESSARLLRGDDMDDVIFGGTADRPARNIAEVVLDLDNSEHAAPPPYTEADEVTVSRRIDRGKGSIYRVNGREVRARDVSLLFADAATGARSSAIVTQGQVAQLIAAKPVERRALLDEAAGITGLHSRRREADVKLDGAEENLKRVEDILGTLAVQERQLNRQAQQAARYRAICNDIQRMEFLLLWRRWRLADTAIGQARQGLHAAEQAVALREQIASAAIDSHEAMLVALPELRRGEGGIGNAVHRLTLAKVEVENDEQRSRLALDEARRQTEQLAADLARQQAVAFDAGATLARARQEQAQINASIAQEADQQATAEASAMDVTAEVGTLERKLEALTNRVAAAEAERGALQRSAGDLQDRYRRLAARANALADQHRTLMREREQAFDPVASEQVVSAAAREVQAARAAMTDAENARATETAEACRGQAALQAAAIAHGALAAEERALAKLVDADPSSRHRAPAIDALRVERGLRAALAGVLGDDLFAALDNSAGDNSAGDDGNDDAPSRWRPLPPLAALAPLPVGTVALAELIEAPPALHRRLSQIGVLDADADGDALQPRLTPGQRLVGRDGAVWRWDGFVARAGHPPAAAVRLEQRAQLDDVRLRRQHAEKLLDAATCQADGAARAVSVATAEERRARDHSQDAEATLQRQREAHLRGSERRASLQLRCSTIGDSHRSAEVERDDTARALQQSLDQLTTLPDVAREPADAKALRRELAELRGRQQDARARLDSLRRDAAGRRRRSDSLTAEIASWQRRDDEARQHIVALTARRDDAEAELARLAALPADHAARRHRLDQELLAASERHHQATAALTDAEARLKETDQARRVAETALADAREQRVRAEAALDHATQALDAARAQIGERLGLSAEQLAEAIAGGCSVDDDKEAIDPADAERRLDELRRQRDVMGPVNLCAEQEIAQLHQQVEELTTQRQDLVTAIGTLRRAIGELDREARDRLLAAFEEINRHFRELFTRLFGGGRAHLSLTDSDDPLSAGLEVMASPPGKRLQVMSLLSGGEQTLSALALRFALFRVKPTPICVLDEVDAPLDDANVDRLCWLLNDLTALGTRFLVVTHHRMTMARMDRLYGVTMAEKGVSQLVSVDLRRADTSRQSARTAREFDRLHS